MRINFKKIGSVLASLAMLGSTAGIALAANYPQPFVVGGVSDVAIVIGAAAPAPFTDQQSAASIGSNLATALAGQAISGTGETIVSGGDSYKIELGSTYLNLGDKLTDVVTGTIDVDDMPNLLADGAIVGKKNSVEYKYTQEIILNDTMNYSAFRDRDYNNYKTSLGIPISDGDAVAVYKLAWTKSPRSGVSSADVLTNLENIKITIMGKEYTILNPKNSSNIVMDLMGGAVSGTLDVGETITVTLGGHTYAMRIKYIGSSTVKVCVSVDGGAEEKCDLELEAGSTTELSDGTQLGIRGIDYQDYAGGIQSIDYSLGAEKITNENGQTVELNGEDITGLTATIPRTDTGDSTYPHEIGDISLTWEAESDQFVTSESEVSFPGLESFKIQAGAFYTPAEEIIKIEPGSDYRMELIIPIDSGLATIPLLYGNLSTWTHIGSDTDKILVTNTSVILWNTTENTDPKWNLSSSGNADSFVVSWNDSSNSESHYLYADVYQSEGVNYTKVYDLVADPDKKNPVCDKANGKSCTIGTNTVITFSNANYKDDSVIITGGTGVSFNRIYSKEGLVCYLPLDNESGSGITEEYRGVVNLSKSHGAGSGITEWTLRCWEEDKDENLGEGTEINFTLGFRSDEAEVKRIASVWADKSSGSHSSPGMETEPDSYEYVAWVASKLATKVLYKKHTGAPSSAEVTYHGGESYANVYITSPETTVTISKDGESVSIVPIKDTEITSAEKAKNLIIVGGSCVNTVAASLLGVSFPTCEADWTAATNVGADQFLIETFDSPYTTGQVAMLVAGYEAQDTANAANYLTTLGTTNIDTSAGKKYIGTSATSAELVTT